MTINEYIKKILKDSIKPEKNDELDSLIKYINFNDYRYLEILLNKIFYKNLDIRIKGNEFSATLEGNGEPLTCISAMFKYICIMVKKQNIDKDEILDLFKYYLNK